MFHKLLIANRAEIACRITRTAHRLGVKVAAVYSEVGCARARTCGWRTRRGPSAPGPATRELPQCRPDPAGREAGRRGCHSSRVRIPFRERRLCRRLRRCRHRVHRPAGRGHRGDGLEERGEGAHAEGRRAHAARLSRRGAERGRARAPAPSQLGFPLIIKPSGGGGGKGMHIVNERASCAPALATAKRLAAAAFKDDRLLLERYLPAPRHVEVQVFADQHGGHRSSVRPRLLGAAPPSEAHRRSAGAGHRCGRSQNACTPPRARSRVKWATSARAPSSSC